MKYDYAAGLEIVRRALSVPLQTIADNAGAKGTVVVARVTEGDRKIGAAFGFNALTLEYGDLLKQGVLTPAKVDPPIASSPRRSSPRMNTPATPTRAAGWAGWEAWAGWAAWGGWGSRFHRRHGRGVPCR